MKTKTLLGAIIIATAIFSCHGTSSKDYDKKEKNDPAKIDVPGNSDATNPSLADTAKSQKDTTTKK
ncbi:MAG TPA: hypothetical protein VK787_11700 [Puia sp.]|jgi:hypothetical protein|nr:hypothetical protein [Puia sp.]